MRDRNDEIHKATNRALGRIPRIMFGSLGVAAATLIPLWYLFGNSPLLLLVLLPVLAFYGLVARWSMRKHRREMARAIDRQEEIAEVLRGKKIVERDSKGDGA